VRDWSEASIFYYTLPNERRVRTTVTYAGGAQRNPGPPGAAPDGLHTEHVEKRVLRRVDLRYECHAAGRQHATVSANSPCAARHDHDCSALDARGGRWDVRVALSREERVPATQLPSSIQPQRVVLRQRKTFLCGDCAGRPLWALDFTLAWAGKTRAAAERMQRQHEPEYHIECECLEPGAYLQQHDDVYVAASILMKMSDFFDSACSFQFVPVP
jgi:hypothetical protein